MSATAEKTVKPANVARQTATQETFFRKADQQAGFFGGTQESAFFGGEQSQFFSATPVQPKLSVSSPDDPYEKEADAVAEKVMRMPEPVAAVPVERREEEQLARKENDALADIKPVQEAPAITPLQRKCAACAEEYKGVPSELSTQVQRQVSSGYDEDAPDIQAKFVPQRHAIQRKGRDPPATPHTGFETSLSASKGGGSALPDTTRQFMEKRFQADFSSVRIHTGTQAEQMSSAIRAQAFTHGDDIYFNSGTYAPGTAEGSRLLAHELTHTVQQGAANRQVAPANTIPPQLQNNGPPAKTGTEVPFRRSGPVENEKRERAVTTGLKQAGVTPSERERTANRNNISRSTVARNRAMPPRRPVSARAAAGNTRRRPGARPRRAAARRQARSPGRAPKTDAGKDADSKTGDKKAAGKGGLNTGINVTELRKGGLAPIRSKYEHSQKVVDAIRTRSAVSRENFITSISERSGNVQMLLNNHLETLQRTGQSQHQRMQRVFAAAKTNIGTVIDSSSGNISSHGNAQTARLSETHTALSDNVNTIFETGHSGVESLSTSYSERSTNTANQAASQFEANVQSNINETYQIRDQKNNVDTGDSAVNEAMREAGNTVASDTTIKVSDGMTDAINGILASGPETANQFIEQGVAAADQLVEGKTGVDNQVNEIFTNAATGIGQMAQAAAGSVQQQKAPVISGLSAFENSVTTQLHTQVQEKISDFHRAGTHIMSAFKQQATQSLSAGDTYLTQISNQVSNVRIAEKEAATVQNYAEQDITRSYESLHTNLNSSTEIVNQEINQKGSQIVTGIQAVSNPITT